MSDRATELARAKINLALHVTGRRDDGYHALDSLVVFAALGDVVTVEPAADWSLHVAGPMSDRIPAGDDNLVLRAARMTEGPPAAITLDKRLPVAAGIGGGSADAAATWRALRALDGRALPGTPMRIGADVAVCLRNRPARMRGAGEVLDDVPALPQLHLCLVNPRFAVSTARVFGALVDRANAPLAPMPSWPRASDLAAWLTEQRNDLEGPAIELVPEIRHVLSCLRKTDECLLARMSGSGATCFGLYAEARHAQAAAAAVSAARPDWWVEATQAG